MPLFVPSALPGLFQTNVTAAAPGGTNLTSSATGHTKGAWADLIATIDKPSYGVYIDFSGVVVSTSVTAYVVDLGIISGAEIVVIPELNCWGCPTSGGRGYYIPVYLPSGVALRMRGQSSVTSDVVGVAAYIFQTPQYPFIVSRWKNYGFVSASTRGTSVTPGTNAFGSWTEIPAATTTTRTHNVWLASLDGITDASLDLSNYCLEIGHGGTGSPQIIGRFNYRANANEELAGFASPIYHPVPSGSQLVARLSVSTGVEARGVMVYAGD